MDSKERRYQMWLAREKKKEASQSDMQKRIDSNDPTLGMSLGEKVLAGVGRGMHNVYQQGGNMLGMISDEELAQQAVIDEPLLNTGAGKTGSFVGETAMLAPIGVAGRMAKPVIGAAPALAAEGAAEGAILAGPDNRLQGAAAGGALAPTMGYVGGKAVGGQKPTANAKLLMDEGVDLTPGQMNPKGMLAALEQSAPARMTPSVAMARDKASLDQFGAMINRSTPPGGSKVATSNVSEMTDELYKQFNKNYDQVKDFPANTMGMKEQMIKRVKKSASKTDSQDADLRWLDNEMSKFKGDMTTTDLIELRSNVRGRMREAFKKNEFDDVRSMEGVEDVITKRIDRALPNEKRRLLRETDAQYGNYKVIEDVAWRAGDAEGVTPFKMSQAVKMASQSKGKYARGGGGDLRELTKAGMEVLGTTTPPTGMSLMAPAALGSAGYAAGGAFGGLGGLVLPAAITAGMSATKTGRKLYKGETVAQKALQAANMPLIPELIRAMGINAAIGD